jgi:hypothetical protein
MQTIETQINKQMLFTLTSLEDKIKESLKEIAKVKYLFDKAIVIKKDSPQVKSLNGLWSGIKIDEEDLELAKKSLFSYEPS